MKRITLGVLVTGMLLFIHPAIASPENVLPAEQEKAEQLIQRLEEIKSMDKSDLSSVEKRKLRREVHTIKKELQEVRGGVYISVGAIIIIALLLIILL